LAVFCYTDNMHDKRKLRTWIEIDIKAIAHNYRLFRKLIGPSVKLLAVVKSNAYGHNLHEFAPEMIKNGIDWLGVDSAVEALALRNGKAKVPLLVLGHTLPEMYDDVCRKNISITISSFAQLQEIQRKEKREKRNGMGQPLRVHIKVDTGMHRQGFLAEDATQLIALLKKFDPKRTEIEGLYTHFAEAKNPRSGDNTRRQIKEFEQWIKLFHDAGIRPLVHAAATGAALLYPSARYDMVRIGIGSYGLWPSPEAEHFYSRKMKLKPVLSWRAVVSEVKRIKKGERVGYDFTEMLTRDSTLAVVPIGYWHGIPRLASSRARTLIHGRTARIVGRVSMDMIVVDVTDITDVKAGDVATLIGRDGKEEIKASELAIFASTTHYEIVTRLNPLIKRFFC
jgi:alanine racemase